MFFSSIVGLNTTTLGTKISKKPWSSSNKLASYRLDMLCPS